MREFYTEMPVTNNISNADFITAAASWINNIPNSKIKKHKFAENHSDHMHVISEDGLEDFEVRVAITNKSEIIGFRYQISDPNGRRWQTDSILLKKEETSWLSIRVRCQAIKHGATLEHPNSPHFCKVPFERDWNRCGDLELISGYPRSINELPETPAIPAVILKGSSATPAFVKLASDLRGICEVYYDVNLRGDAYIYYLDQRYPVDGAPSRNAREYIKMKVNQFNISSAIKKGGDWTLLLDSQTRIARMARMQADQKNSSRSDDAELLQLYSEENETLRRERNELNVEVSSLRSLITNLSSKNKLRNFETPEIFDGEKLIQFRNIKLAVERSGVDNRTINYLGYMEPEGDFSAAEAKARDLKNQLAKAYKTNNPINGIMKILKPLGFTKSTHGPHIKIDPPPHLNNMGPHTLAKTPSDYRSMQNNERQLIKWLGLGAV